MCTSCSCWCTPVYLKESPTQANPSLQARRPWSPHYTTLHIHTYIHTTVRTTHAPSGKNSSSKRNLFLDDSSLFSQELPVESPEIHALLAKLQDVAGGNLEPDWSSGVGPSYGQVKATPREGENGGPPSWDLRRGFDGKKGSAGDVVPEERCELEDFTQCSKSHLWKLMMSFYDRKGVESWSQVGSY